MRTITGIVQFIHEPGKEEFISSTLENIIRKSVRETIFFKSFSMTEEEARKEMEELELDEKRMKLISYDQVLSAYQSARVINTFSPYLTHKPILLNIAVSEIENEIITPQAPCMTICYFQGENEEDDASFNLEELLKDEAFSGFQCHVYSESCLDDKETEHNANDIHFPDRYPQFVEAWKKSGPEKDKLFQDFRRYYSLRLCWSTDVIPDDVIFSGKFFG